MKSAGRVTVGRCSRALALVAVAMGIAGVAGAGSTDEKTVTEELLDIMLRSGIIDESQYGDLNERAKEEQQQRAEEAARTMAVAEEAAAAARTLCESRRTAPTADLPYRRRRRLRPGTAGSDPARRRRPAPGGRRPIAPVPGLGR